MTSNNEISKDRPIWFVGAMYDGGSDQTPRFLSDGIWENGYEDKHLALVKSIQPGDRIAIKAAYKRRRNLPFDNRGHNVSVMSIKAIGVVTGNPGDGTTVHVSWTSLEKPREWYFYTNRSTIWKVLPGTWRTDALIGFAFENQVQEYGRWRNEPFWRERFGDKEVDTGRYKWTQFYEAMADGLRRYRSNRAPLIEAIHAISKRVEGLSNLKDQFSDGTSGPLKDVCPFTTMGIFNRHTKEKNRIAIARELAAFLGVKEPVPTSFEGIPILNNQKSWLFDYQVNRKPDDIDSLWSVFEAALVWVESEDFEAKATFAEAYENANGRRNVGWNLTVGLYWIRPWDFLSLDSRSQAYITQKLGIEIGLNGPKNRCSAVDYLVVKDSVEAHFNESAYPVHSFPDVSFEAYSNNDIQVRPEADADSVEDGFKVEEKPVELEAFSNAPIPESYSLADILSEGCFLEHSFLKSLLDRLRVKKNLILQGPPGTGKTWLAKRLGYALMGKKDESKIRALQFHPNLSYEDFVRGWRPNGNGTLALIDGPFLEMIQAAVKEPNETFVVVIEEINRGNPAQILGEMLTLLEADKRTPTEALELSYRRTVTERVHIPSNLFVIGTMNIADRSLALVDLALRRRFAFVNLEPKLGEVWRNWVSTRFGIEAGILLDIERRLLALNDEIGSDSTLGRHFRIGHSYVTPPLDTPIADPLGWFKQVVETEIGPLLEEYWFDAADKSRSARERLLQGL